MDLDHSTGVGDLKVSLSQSYLGPLIDGMVLLSCPASRYFRIEARDISSTDRNRAWKIRLTLL
jgi:hypothetical protein